MTRRAILFCALAAAGADCFLSPAGGLRAPAVRLRSAAMPLRMTVNEWVKAVDPISEQEYWYNPLTLESSWERPADMEAASDVRAPPPEAGTRSDSLWEQGVAGSKQQQLAKILQNQETRARARAEKQALEQAVQRERRRWRSRVLLPQRTPAELLQATSRLQQAASTHGSAMRPIHIHSMPPGMAQEGRPRSRTNARSRRRPGVVMTVPKGAQ